MNLDILDIILGATAAVSFITMLRLYYINKKISKEEKNIGAKLVQLSVMIDAASIVRVTINAKRIVKATF